MIICLVTDRRRLVLPPGNEESATAALVRLVADAAHAGVDLVQIRERDLEARALTDLVARAVDVTGGTGTRVVVNDRLDVALAAGAHGVHLRADSIPAARARTLAPPGFLIGRSVRGEREAETAAAADSLDYLILGTVCATTSKPIEHPPVGMGELERAVRRTSVPILAIGGMTLETIPMVARAGAAGVAAIGLFHPSPGHADEPTDLAGTVAAVRRLFDSVKRVS